MVMSVNTHAGAYLARPVYKAPRARTVREAPHRDHSEHQHSEGEHEDDRRRDERRLEIVSSGESGSGA